MFTDLRHFFSYRNLNKLRIKYQSYSKSIKIDASGSKKFMLFHSTILITYILLFTYYYLLIIIFYCSISTISFNKCQMGFKACQELSQRLQGYNIDFLFLIMQEKFQLQEKNIIEKGFKQVLWG